MSKYWKEVSASEAKEAYDDLDVVQFKVKKEFKHLKAHWNPVESSHRFTDSYQYRILVNE